MPSPAFRPHWTIEELDACFVILDHTSQKLAYILFRGRAGAEIGGEIAYAR